MSEGRRVSRKAQIVRQDAGEPIDADEFNEALSNVYDSRDCPQVTEVPYDALVEDDEDTYFVYAVTNKRIDEDGAREIYEAGREQAGVFDTTVPEPKARPQDTRVAA